MKTIKAWVAAVVAALVLGYGVPAAMASDPQTTISKSLAAFQTMGALPKNGIPPALFKDVQAVALFPGLSKLDFMVSGRAGKGVLLVRDSAGKWSNPVFVTATGGTLGWQIVGDPMDILLLFKDRKSVDAIVKGKLILGGKTAVVAGPLGKSLKGASAAELKAEVNSYVFTHGEFAEVNLATTSLQLSAANDAFYGGKKVHAEDIVSGKVSKPSAEAANLQKLLSDFAARK